MDKRKYIKDNVKNIINPNDNFYNVVNRHGTLIDEMRRIRNRIAHNNSSARGKYRAIVRRYYGAYLNNITPGTLLLSPRKSPPLLAQYIIKSRILIKDLVKK